MVIDMKPCPFCGSADLTMRMHREPAHGGAPADIFVSCNACRARGPEVSQMARDAPEDEARSLWNRRFGIVGAVADNLLSVRPAPGAPSPALAHFNPWELPAMDVEYEVALDDGQRSRGKFENHGRFHSGEFMGGMHGVWFRGTHSPNPVPLRHVRVWRRVEP